MTDMELYELCQRAKLPRFMYDTDSGLDALHRLVAIVNRPEAMPIKEALTIYDSVVCELLRLEQHGKDDHRDSWMGNAIKAVRRLEEHHRKHLPQNDQT